MIDQDFALNRHGRCSDVRRWMQGKTVAQPSGTSPYDPGCVKTLRRITAPGILGPMAMRRTKKRKILSSARHCDQIRFRLRTAKTKSGRFTYPRRTATTNTMYNSRYIDTVGQAAQLLTARLCAGGKASSMNTRFFSVAVVASIALLAGGVGRASASTCSAEYTAANGGATIAGATNIGTVQAGCEIGPYFSTTTGVGTNLGNTPASVSDSVNPSIYEFTWGGGNLTILETLGNNGIKNNINIELGLSTVTLNSNNTLSSDINSVSIPYQSGPTTTGTYVLNNYDLAAGTYVLDTYLGSCGAGQTCSDNDTSTDPTYAVGFTPGLSATPLSAALPLFAGGLGMIGLLGARKRRKAQAA